MESSRVIIELQGILGDAGLEARLRSHTHTSSDAERLERVYTAVFHTRINRTCGNCLYDAFILLKINAKDMENMKERVECAFALKAGAILRVPDGKGGRTLYSNANLTDAVARAWLADNPQSVVLFAKLPAGFVPGQAEASAPKQEPVAEPVAEAEPGENTEPVEPEGEPEGEGDGEAVQAENAENAPVAEEKAAPAEKPATAPKTAAKGAKSGKNTTKKSGKKK